MASVWSAPTSSIWRPSPPRWRPPSSPPARASPCRPRARAGASRRSPGATATSLSWAASRFSLSTAHARLGFFGVGATPVRSAVGEAVLLGREPTAARRAEAAKAAAAALSPDGDLHASAEYRKKVAAVLAERVLAAAVGRCRGGR